MTEIKKIRDIEPKIKKVQEERKNSELEEEVEEAELENFTEFLASHSSGEVTPVLDTEQSQTQEEIRTKETTRPELPREESTRKVSYVQTKEDNMDVKYLSQTSSSSVSPNLRQENIAMTPSATRQQHSESRALESDVRDKYKGGIETSSTGKKKRYAWE